MNDLGTFQNSPLSHIGSKARRAVRLLRLTDQSKRHYVEPFAGGLGMLFRARRENLFKSYRANDLNEHLINFYTTLRDYPAELLKILWHFYQASGSGNEDLFQKCIEDLTSSNDIKRAAAFLIIDKCSIKGIRSPKMVRTATRRNGLTTFMLDRLPLFSELLSGVTLSNVDYRDIDAPPNSFLYADPPYERVGSTFYEHRVDLQEFADWVKHLQCLWMVSLNDSDFTNSLFNEYDRIVEPVNYPAVINPKFSTFERRHRTELLIMNYRRSSRDAFIRLYGWSIQPAKKHPTRCSKRAG